MTWIDRDHRDAGNRRLVFDEGSQLKECPTTHLRPLRSPEPCASADALQLLQGDSALAACSFRHQRLADDVVFVATKPLLFASDGFQFTAKILWPFALRFSSRGGLLKFPSLIGVPLSDLLDAVAAERLAVAIGGQIDDSEIHADEVSDRCRGAGR